MNQISGRAILSRIKSNNTWIWMDGWIYNTLVLCCRCPQYSTYWKGWSICLMVSGVSYWSRLSYCTRTSHDRAVYCLTRAPGHSSSSVLGGPCQMSTNTLNHSNAPHTILYLEYHTLSTTQNTEYSNPDLGFLQSKFC